MINKIILSAIALAASGSLAAAQQPTAINICEVADTKIDSTSISNNIPTRNNNPGNIKKTGHTYLGEINDSDTYETFVDVSWGFAAMFDLLERRYSGKTINQAISIYAPDFENNTNGYVTYIGDRTGLDVDAVKINVFNLPTIIPIVEAMARMEGGKNWTMEDLYLGWIRWAGCSLPAR